MAVDRKGETELEGWSKRPRLPELEDLPYLPSWWRDWMTDCLEMIQRITQPYRNVEPLLRRLIERTAASAIVDFGSGAAGPAVEIFERLVKTFPDLTLTLTDKFPNQAAARRVAHRARENNLDITYRSESVEMSKPPTGTIGVRTIFTAFHHLSPEDALRVLEAAVRDRQPLAIFEVTGRSPAHFVMNALIPFLVLGITPFLRPRSPGRFAATYVLPFIPLGCLWDGIISNLRTYSVEDLYNLSRRLDAPDVEFEIGRFTALGPLRGTYLLCSPRAPV
ncbi:MAG: hypothetical protein IT290_10480 [Deltaproteobacteria bacterium]|nr:hypothetical protein [Deltaproteobacteria bacterium]